MSHPRPRLAVTLGDPRGIGPEVVAKALREPIDAAITLVGPDDLIGSIASERPRPPKTAPDHVVGTGRWGKGDQEAGLHAGRAVELAVGLVQAGEADAVVTAPGHKVALRAAGFAYPGHTELLAHLTGDVDVAMMLTAPNLRVALVTTHLPLREVPGAVTEEGIVTVARVTADGLRCWFGFAQPRLVLCALNPHAGESGLLGDEDDRILRPAAVAAGIAGPFPADTVFVRAMRGEFDCVLAPYHDVGMTAIKVAAFGRAVNVTLGLPFPRTAPDHGTAFDIAGTGVADPSSMRRAMELAGEMVRQGKGKQKGDRAS